MGYIGRFILFGVKYTPVVKIELGIGIVKLYRMNIRLKI
jgi:hypothetical protein